MTQLVKYEAMRQAIIAAHSVDELKDIRDKAEALRQYAKQSKMGVHDINRVTEIKLRAERRAGEILRETELNTGTKGQLNGRSSGGDIVSLPESDLPKLTDVGVTAKQSSRWQMLASLPEDIFESTIEEYKERENEITTAVLMGIAREHKNKKEQEERRKNVKPVDLGQHDIRVCSIDELDLPSQSVDMIMTDPPYHDEHLDCYEQLAMLAKSALKPGGFCAVYMGKMYMPQIAQMFCKSGLEYVWQFIAYHPGSNTMMRKLHVFEDNRPIWLWRKVGVPMSFYPVGNGWMPDTIRTERDKEFHDWGQPIDPYLKLIENYTQPGEVVLDPFLGGGTTLAACHRLSRVCYGFDISEECINVSRNRLAHEASIQKP